MKENHIEIFYNESQKEYIENGRINSQKNNYLNSKLLSDLKSIIILPIINKCKFDYFNINEINNDEDLPLFLFKWVILCLFFIQNKVNLIPNEIIENLFPNINIFTQILNIRDILEKYFSKHDISFDYFMNRFCEFLLEKSISIDFLLEQNKLFNSINDFIQEHKKVEISYNIEMNILTNICFNNEINEYYKYILTPTKYSNISELNYQIKSYNKKPLPILSTFITIEKSKDVEKLLEIENINDFINEFAEENWNQISRIHMEEKNIGEYLQKNENDPQYISPLEEKFKIFSESWEKITDIPPFNITKDHKVKNIINDEKDEKNPIHRMYNELINIQNTFLNKIISKYDEIEKNDKDNIKKDLIISNAIEQIKKPIIIQYATKSDVFTFNVNNKIILSFDELISFYSFKDIFNGEKINYKNYSEIKFKWNMIEVELINIILTGKKLFSEKQIFYKFYSDPYEMEEKTKIFEKFFDIYKNESLTQNDKNYLTSVTKEMEKFFLPNLEILIFYLMKENRYSGEQSINEVKIPGNLYLNQEFINIFNNNNSLTINKMISIYEFVEELHYDYIKDRYISSEFKETGFIKKNKKIVLDFINNENNRNLKNELLLSLLIKFACRFLPSQLSNIKNRNLFELIKEKYTFPKLIIDELIKLKEEWGIEVQYSIELIDYLKSIIQIPNEKINKKNNDNNNNNQNQNEENRNNEKEENESDDDDNDDDERDI